MCVVHITVYTQEGRNKEKNIICTEELKIRERKRRESTDTDLLTHLLWNISDIKV